MRVASIAAAAIIALSCAGGASAAEFFLNEYAPFVLDDVSSSFGTIVHEMDGTVISNRRIDHSWTYFFGLEPFERHYTRWTGELEVVSIDGADAAGLAVDAERFSISFRADRFGRAELALLDQDSWSIVIDEADLRGDAARAVKGTFYLRVELDIPTSTISCRIDETEIFRRRLPSDGMPALGTVVGFSMETKTQAHRRPDGRVKFGDLKAYAER